jgi:hypothetical protein
MFKVGDYVYYTSGWYDRLNSTARIIRKTDPSPFPYTVRFSKDTMQDATTDDSHLRRSCLLEAVLLFPLTAEVLYSSVRDS